MLGKTMILNMFDFNHTINNELLEFTKNVTPEQWDAPQTFGGRSLHETWFHLLVVEEEWVYFCEQGNPNWGFRAIADYRDVASLRTFSDQDYAHTRAYLETLDEDKLSSTVHGTMPHGVDKTATIWHLLLHTLYHSAQHRSEVATMLSNFNHSPGGIDFLGFGKWGLEGLQG